VPDCRKSRPGARLQSSLSGNLENITKFCVSFRGITTHHRQPSNITVACVWQAFSSPSPLFVTARRPELGSNAVASAECVGGFHPTDGGYRGLQTTRRRVMAAVYAASSRTIILPEIGTVNS